jgi:hypothetical protein
MLLALAGAWIILGDNLGYAAWNGVNFVMTLYLVFSFAGFAGLIVALIKWSSTRLRFAWIAGLSAFAIVCEALIFVAGFVYGRDASLPINSPVEMFGIRCPLLALYGFSIFSCSVQMALSIFRYRQLKNPEIAQCP